MTLHYADSPSLVRLAQRDRERWRGSPAQAFSLIEASPNTTMITTHTNARNAEVQLLDLEAQRCDAMRRADFARLREILHPGLTHVHAKGQTDDYASYFRTGGTLVDYRQIDRLELRVRVLGNTALMTGRQLLVAVRKDGSGTVRIDSQVMQVWTCEDGCWRQLAFQTTPLEMSIT